VKSGSNIIFGQSYKYRWIHFVSRNAILSVCRMAHILFGYSVLERRGRFMFYGNHTTYTSERWSNSKMTMTKLKVTGTKMQ